MILNHYKRVKTVLYYKVTLYFLEYAKFVFLVTVSRIFFWPSLQLLLIQYIPDILGYAAQSTVTETVHTATIA